jgi:DegV family protein with EDD domain
LTIRIVTDSTGDLPADVADRHGIGVVPIYINVGEESYLDGIDLSREDFYARLPDLNPAPTTALPGPALFIQTYQRLIDEGATEILSVHISRELSGVVNMAQLAAQDVPVPVTVVDSGSLSLGLGFLAQAAAEAAAGGASMAEILALVEDQRRRTHVFAMLDTLEFLRRSGRMNRVLATVGGWLHLKPLLKMTDGHATAERILSGEASVRRLLALLEEALPLERVALVHTHALEKAQALRDRAQHLLPHGDLLSVDITPVLGAHLGPGAVGFACVTGAG